MKRYLPLGAGALFMGLLLSVIGYNWWSLHCGRCTPDTFRTLGPQGAGFFFVLLAAVALLLLLRRRRFSRRDASRCLCGMTLARGWLFCPGCGQRRGQKS